MFSNSGNQLVAIQYLTRLFDNEEKRLVVIESKITQLISQSGVVISLIAFLVPFLYERLITSNCLIKVGFSLLFILTVTLLGFSIYTASKIFNVKKFRYMDCDTASVTQNFDTIEEFNSEYISDLKNSIENNNKVNNEKANILLKSHFYFVRGLYSLITLTIILILNFLFQ
ncbi:hypothetical protein MHJ94_03595 [Chryseobacterium taklimakanense]|uniref:Uncharacterized protein n=1 Tax=Chryseobacterium taklimakanense TaxID=536441 RepID=A0A239X5R6_9FLAO|nr:hypothetical protein [Chryseobacterium taklimakanense]MCG7280373.1 hypothetical protein [Chryseobacterium taklimakanense]SNV42055.1 Uncharacterised protein [Chryseobacterium taklimakanense]